MLRQCYQQMLFLGGKDRELRTIDDNEGDRLIMERKMTANTRDRLW